MTNPENYDECALYSMDERFERGARWFGNITEYVWKLTGTHEYVGEKLIQAVDDVSSSRARAFGNCRGSSGFLSQ